MQYEMEAQWCGGKLTWGGEMSEVCLSLSPMFRGRRQVLSGYSNGVARMWCTRRQLFSQKDGNKMKINLKKSREETCQCDLNTACFCSQTLLSFVCSWVTFDSSPCQYVCIDHMPVMLMVLLIKDTETGCHEGVRGKAVCKQSLLGSSLREQIFAKGGGNPS